MAATCKRNTVVIYLNMAKLLFVHFIILAAALFSSCHKNSSHQKDDYYKQHLKTAGELINSKPDSAVAIYRTILADSSKVSETALNQVMFGLAKSLPLNQKSDSAIYWAERSYQLALAREDTVQAIKSLLTAGNINTRTSRTRRAITFYSRGLLLAEAAHLPELQPGFLIGIGNIQQEQSDYDSAIISFTKAAKAAQLSGQKNIEAIAYNNIGHLMEQLNDYKEAIRYTSMALELDKEKENSLDYAVYLLNMGNQYKSLKNADSSMKYYNLAEKIYLTANDSLSLIRLMYNRAFIYANTGKMQKAVADLKIVQHFSRKYNLPEGQIYACNALSEFMLLNNNAAEALSFADEGIAIAYSNGIHAQLPILYNEKSEALKAQGNYPAAFAAMTYSRRIADSITSITRQSEIAALKVQFDTQLKDTEIENLSAELLAESKARRLQLFITVLSLLLLAGGAISMISVFRLLKTRTSAYNALLAIYGGKSTAALSENRSGTICSFAETDKQEADRLNGNQVLQDSGTGEKQDSFSDSTYRKIVQLMEKNQVYLDAQLTTEKLARISDMDKKELSQLLRNKFGSGFQQFVNKFRVEHAMQLLSKRENDNLKVEYIGLQSGFNSRATFYSIFTSYTGLPPAVYRQGMIDQETKI